MSGPVMSLEILASAESVQSAMNSGGRLLLPIAMPLFLSYLLFTVGAVLVSGAVSRWRSRNQDAKAADVPAVPRRAQGWVVDPFVGRRA